VRPLLHDADEGAGHRVLHVASRRAIGQAVVALLPRGAAARTPNGVHQTPLAAALPWLTDLLRRPRGGGGAVARRAARRPPLRAAAVGPALRRGGGAADTASVSAAHRDRLDNGRVVVVVALLHAGADPSGVSHHAAALCARAVARVPRRSGRGGPCAGPPRGGSRRGRGPPR